MAIESEESNSSDVEELTHEKPKETADVVRAEYNVPESWTDEQVLSWFESIASLPADTQMQDSEGNWINDPTNENTASSGSVVEESEAQVAPVDPEAGDPSQQAEDTPARGQTRVIAHVDELPFIDDKEASNSEEVEAELREQYKLPEEWSAEDVHNWNQNGGVDRGRTADGVFIVDPTREQRPVNEWATEELLAALKGEIEVNDNKLSALVREYRQRESLEEAWSFREAVDFFRNGATPAKTASGLWVSDITRNEKAVSSWSDAELEAWAKGEIKAVGKANDSRVANELKARFKLNSKTNSPQDVIKAFKQKQDSTPVKVVMEEPKTTSVIKPTYEGLTSLNQNYIESTLEQYAATVKPGKEVSEAVGKAEETRLENLFQYVIALEPQGMVAGMNIIRDFMRKHIDTLWNADNAHRFVHLLRAENSFRERHQNFVELFRIYLNPNKDVRKQADIRYLLAKQPVDKQPLLVEYFEKYV